MRKIKNRSEFAAKAFTLVELLVVIGIIALLISILLPALGKARKTARKAQCLSNLHQMDIALLMYANQYKRGVPFYETGGTGSYGSLWLGALASMNSSVYKAQLCPEASDPFPTSPIIADRTGTAFNCWGPSTYTMLQSITGSDYTGSYGINGWIYWYNTANPPIRGELPQFSSGGRIPVMVNTDYNTDYLSPSTWNRASEVPAFLDSIWTDGWPSNTDTVPYNTKVGAYLKSTTQIPDQNNAANVGEMGRFCIARHGKAVNVAFIDGHAETVPLQKLWTLHWFARYVPPSTLPLVPGPNN